MANSFMGVTELISLGSAFVATLAALYARWAARAAERQNEISLHSERLRVYRGVVSFGVKLAAQGPSIKETDVWAFDEWVQLSEFYFSKPIFERLDTVFRDSLSLLGKNDELATNDISAETRKEINSQRHSLHRKLRDECFSIRDEMKKVLRVTN